MKNIWSYLSHIYSFIKNKLFGVYLYENTSCKFDLYSLVSNSDTFDTFFTFSLLKYFCINKSSLKREEVKVYSCKKGVGTTKKAIYIVVDVKDSAGFRSWISENLDA